MFDATLNRTDHKHNITQAQTGKVKQKMQQKLDTQQQRQTLQNTTAHRQTQNTQTIEPQVPAASPTHAAKPEKQRYIVSIQRQKKNHFTKVSVDDVTRGHRAEEDEENVQKYGGGKSNIVDQKHVDKN